MATVLPIHHHESERPCARLSIRAARQAAQTMRHGPVPLRAQALPERLNPDADGRRVRNGEGPPCGGVPLPSRPQPLAGISHPTNERKETKVSRASQRDRAWWARQLPLPCARCGRPVHPSEPWDVGHRIPQVIDPGRARDRDNQWPEHRYCNRSAGASTARTVPVVRRRPL